MPTPSHTDGSSRRCGCAGSRWFSIASSRAVAPSLQDVVQINYVGRLEDGTEFDRGNRVPMSLDQVVPGFAEAPCGRADEDERAVPVGRDLAQRTVPVDRHGIDVAEGIRRAGDAGEPSSTGGRPNACALCLCPELWTPTLVPGGDGCGCKVAPNSWKVCG